MSDIIELLKSHDENDRKKAVLALAKKPSKDNLLIIRDVAESDESVEVRFFARKALFCIKEALKPKVSSDTSVAVNLKSIAKYFADDKSVDEKLSVIQLAINKNMSVITDAFVEQLACEKSPEVTSALLIAIGKLGDDSKIKAIAPFLNSENSRVRANAIEALEYIGSTKIYPYVILKIEDPDNRVRSNAAKALKKLDSVTALRILKAMLASSNIAMQASAAYVMRFVIDEANIELLAPLLKSTHEPVRDNAIIALTKYKENGLKRAGELLKNIGTIQTSLKGPFEKDSIIEKTVEDKLVEKLKSADCAVRIEAVNESMQKGGLGFAKVLLDHLKIERDNKAVATILISLGRLQYKDAIEEVVKFLKSRDARCRANAVEAIRLIGVKDALKELGAYLKDKNNRVKANAVIALNNEDGFDLFTPLSEMAESGEELMQKSAIYAIMEIGRHQFYGFLLILEKSPFKEVASRAKECIKKLTDGGVKIEKVRYNSGIHIKSGEKDDFKDGNSSAAGLNYASKGVIGFIDKTGALKVDFLFEEAGDFSSDLAPVKSGGKWGYCDSTGKILITNIFEAAEKFSGGLGAVKMSDKWGFVDKHGMLVINSEYPEVGMFFDNLAPVRQGKLWGYVDKKGAFVIKPQFDSAESFSGGFALVKMKGWFGKKIKAFIDKTGNIVINLKFDNAFGFSDSMARVLKGDKWGFIDKAGRVVIKPQFDGASDFHEGFAAIELKGKKGFVDKNSKLIIEAKYDEVKRFSDALAPVCQSSKWGYADRDGKLFIKPKYDDAKEFVNNLAPVKVKNKWGVINKIEKFIVEPAYEDINFFCEGFACVKKPQLNK
jgi:HEAT repeat protein